MTHDKQETSGREPLLTVPTRAKRYYVWSFVVLFVGGIGVLVADKVATSDTVTPLSLTATVCMYIGSVALGAVASSTLVAELVGGIYTVMVLADKWLKGIQAREEARQAARTEAAQRQERKRLLDLLSAEVPDEAKTEKDRKLHALLQTLKQDDATWQNWQEILALLHEMLNEGNTGGGRK